MVLQRKKEGKEEASRENPISDLGLKEDKFSLWAARSLNFEKENRGWVDDEHTPENRVAKYLRIFGRINVKRRGGGETPQASIFAVHILYEHGSGGSRGKKKDRYGTSPNDYHGPGRFRRPTQRVNGHLHQRVTANSW